MYEIKIISLVIRKIVYTYYTCIFMKKGDIIELKLFYVIILITINIFGVCGI